MSARHRYKCTADAQMKAILRVNKDNCDVTRLAARDASNFSKRKFIRPFRGQAKIFFRWSMWSKILQIYSILKRSIAMAIIIIIIVIIIIIIIIIIGR